MRNQTLLKAIVFCTVMMLAAQVSAQPTRRGGLYGDWIVKSEFNGRQMESILSFSRDQERNWTGQWISFFGLTELKDLKYEDGQLSFSRTRRNRDGQSSTSTFKGTITDGKLSGLVSSDQREYALEGQRAPRMPRAVGVWEMKSKREDQEFTSTLTVKVDKEGVLTAQWISERGEPKITDVQYSRGNLTFKMKSSNPDRQWEAAFEGTLQQNALSGTLKSERGERTVEGKRTGAALIGTWNLEVTSDRGTRKQRFRINPDMTGLYGAAPIKKVNLEGDQVDFKINLKFGDREFEMDFQGKIEESKLTGELTTSMGAQKITGTKVARRSRPRGTQ